MLIKPLAEDDDSIINMFELLSFAQLWKSFQSCFGGWWKHSSDNPSNKQNPVVAWAETAGDYHPFVSRHAVWTEPPSSLQCTTQVFVSRPYFNAKYILRLWIVGYFPTQAWFDIAWGAIWLGNVRTDVHLGFYSSTRKVKEMGKG